jgi:uncharacterized protein (TIRG00374 family)
LKRTVSNLLKIGVSVAILIYLAVQARKSLPDLKGQPPDWGLLAISSILCFLMVVLTIIRWHLLVRALELPFRWRDAFRLGFLGYMLNFVSLGSVGGDLFRAIFIAREQPGRRAEAVATVVVDRLIGLYALFVVATLAVLFTGLSSHPHEAVRWLCRLTIFSTAVSTICVMLVLTPGFTQGRLSRWMSHLPRIGPTLARLLNAVRLYRRKYPILLMTGLMSLGVHTFSTIGIYLAAKGLPGNAPTLAEHFLIVPLAMLAGALPVSLSGLGVFEGVLDVLYVQIPSEGSVLVGSGFIVGLAYRAITIGIAIVGFCYYLANRAAVAQVMRQAAREAKEEAQGDGTPTEAMPGPAAAR